MKNKRLKNHYQILDVARGFAILLMFIYHFSYDLDYFGFIEQNFTKDNFWINFRDLIVTLFLGIMGISLYLASYQGLHKKRFQKRLLLLILYSILVSISSWAIFPKAMIFFGILHFIAFASVLGLFFVQLGIINLFLGIALIIIAQTISHPVFDHSYMQWFGLTTKLPVTVDYVPVLPWFGVVLIGIYLGQWLSRQPNNSFFVSWKSQHPAMRLLALGGRHSLNIYLLHQPLFFAILYIISQVTG